MTYHDIHWTFSCVIRFGVFFINFRWKQSVLLLKHSRWEGVRIQISSLLTGTQYQVDIWVPSLRCCAPLYSVIFTIPAWVIFPHILFVSCFCSDLASENEFCILVKTGQMFLFLIWVQLIHREEARLTKQKEEGCVTKTNLQYYGFSFLYLLSFDVSDAWNTSKIAPTLTLPLDWHQ